jgi:hypothetical protein
LDFTIENGKMLHKMLLDRNPEEAIMNDWKNLITDKLYSLLRKDGFAEDRISVATAVVLKAFDI